MKDLEAAPMTAFDELTSPKNDAHVATGDLPNSNPRGASLFTLLVVSIPRMATQMAWAAQWAALGPYLGTMLPKFAVQLTQIVGPLSGILVGPIVGAVSDRSLNKWGRRPPFLVIAGVLSIFCWVLMGEALGDYGDGKDGSMTSRKWAAFLVVCFYIWMDITVNVVQTPDFQLVADIAGDRQTTGAVVGQSWGNVGSVGVH